MLRITLVMVLCTAIASLAKADEPDPAEALRKEIGAQIEAANLAYDAAMKLARENVAKLLERKISFATSRGDIQAADAAKLELENFLVKDQKPTIVTVRIFDTVSNREIQRLKRVHEDGVRRFTKAGMARDARNLQDIVEALMIQNLESSSSGILDRQLLTNPGCEQAPTNNTLVGWAIALGKWKRSVDNPDPKTGEASFCSFGARACTLIQSVEVDELASSIDTSSINFEFTGDVWRQDAKENGGLAIDFLDRRGQVIESYKTPWVGQLRSWQSLSMEGPVPVNTRAVRVQLNGRTRPRYPKNWVSIRFDDLDLRLTLKK